MLTGSLKAFWKEVVPEVRWEKQGSSGHVERRRGTSMPGSSVGNGTEVGKTGTCYIRGQTVGNTLEKCTGSEHKRPKCHSKG